MPAPGRVRVMPTPGRVRVMPAPRRLRVMPTPRRARVMPTPGRLRVMPTPGRLRVMPTPRRLRVMPTPRVRGVMPAPRRLRVMPTAPESLSSSAGAVTVSARAAERVRAPRGNLRGRAAHRIKRRGADRRGQHADGQQAAEQGTSGSTPLTLFLLRRHSFRQLRLRCSPSNGCSHGEAIRWESLRLNPSARNRLANCGA